MSEFPLRYARRNLLIGRGGEAAALYRLDTLAYPFLPVAEKWRALRRLAHLAQLLGADFSLWRVTRSYPAERYAAELEDLADPAHADSGGWRRYLAGHAERLGELRSSLTEVYLAVSLAERPDGGVGAGVMRSADHARRRLEELAGVGGAATARRRGALARLPSPSSAPSSVSPAPSGCAGPRRASCSGCCAAASAAASASPSSSATGSPTRL